MQNTHRLFIIVVLAVPIFLMSIANADGAKVPTYTAKVGEQKKIAFTLTINQGIEQPELKGTLPSTDLKALKEKRVVNKKIREERKARRESRLVRQFEKKVEARKKLKKEKEQLEN